MRPKDISSKLPKLISLIRIIWVNSPHYNTRERLTSLFRKVRVYGAGTKGSSDLLKDGEAFRGTYVLKGTEEWPGGVRQGSWASLPASSSPGVLCALGWGLGLTACFQIEVAKVGRGPLRRQGSRAQWRGAGGTDPRLSHAGGDDPLLLISQGGNCRE